MRINIKNFTSLAILLLSSALYSQTITGKINCRNANDDYIDKVVVFVNGITNTIDDAEKSRALLEKKLIFECSVFDNCAVQKYYNKTQNMLNDTQELNLVGDQLEQAAANLALRRLAIVINIDYLKYKNHLQKNSNININNYAKADKKVLEILRGLTKDALSKDDEVVISFKEGGVDIVSWLNNYLMKKAKLRTPFNSLVTATIHDKKEFYNAKFKVYFYKMIRNVYFNNKDFYSRDTVAKAAITKSVEGLVSYLEELLLSGKKIVVVAHSQGNHIIELAYSVLREKWGEDALRAIQVVGIAAVSSTTPSDTYLTWDKDAVVNLLNDSISDGEQLKSNFKSTTSYIPITNNHSFISVYMNHNLTGRYYPNGHGNLNGVQSYLIEMEVNSKKEYPIDDWIIGLISGSMDEAVPYVNEISSSGIITAALRWEQYDDMDLWTNENNQNLVSYENQTGIFDSKLDRDDTDGEGPEHYTANLSCENLQNKIWKFGIHQYDSGGSPAVAYFSVKIGNANLVHKTYALSSWPADIQWIATIKFGDMQDNSIISYTIELKDRI